MIKTQNTIHIEQRIQDLESTISKIDDLTKFDATGNRIYGIISITLGIWHIVSIH